MITTQRTPAPDPQVMTSAPVPPRLGLAKGTVVVTMDGLRRIEELHGGLRIVTRSGARELLELLRVGPSYELVFKSPEIVYLADGQIHSDTCLPFAA